MDAALELLFDVPWLVIAALGLVAAGGLLYGLLRGERLATRIGLAAAVLLLVWVGLSAAFETPLESAESRTRAVADAFETSDWDALSKLIEPETRFYNRLVGPQIVDAARLTHDALGVQSLMLTEVSPERSGEQINVFLKVLSQHDAGAARTVSTAYRFEYNRRAGVWKLEHIEPLATQTFDAPAYMRFIVVPPEPEPATP